MFSRILAFRTLLLLLLAGALGLSAPVWAQAAVAPLPGSFSAASLEPGFTPNEGARPAGSFPLHLTFALKSAKEADLPALLAAQQDKKSPSYRKWLTPAEFGQRFGAEDADVKAVEDYAHSKGFTTRVDSNHLFVQADTTVAGAESAFGITLSGFNRTADLITLGESPTFYAPDQAPRVPASLAVRLKGIFGLTDFIQAHFKAKTLARAAPLKVTAGPLVPVSSVSASPSFSSPLSPQQLSTVYEIDAIHNLGYYGAGTTIGIYSPTQYAPSDISLFASSYGLSGFTVTNVNIDGGPGDLSGQVEACLDIETIIGQAPNTNVYVYQGPNNGTLDYWSRIASDDLPIISDSWSFNERSLHLNGNDAYVNSVSSYLNQMQSQGQAHYVATGDNGAFDGNGNPLINFPSSHPGSTAVGGTDQLVDDGSSNWSSEVGWSGSGGGLSYYFAEPSWQTGPGVSNAYSNGQRQVPDVSALGGPTPGYSIATEGGFYHVWGTSASTPLWASVNVLLNQAVNSRFGNLNSYFYYLGTDVNDFNNAEIYHDMTSGNNGYPTTSDWDFVTGWGSARFAKLYYQLFDLPVIYPYSLSGWPAPINIAGASGEPAYFDNQTTYTINAAYANSGLADAPREYFDVNLDGTDHTQYSISDPSGYYVVYSNLFSTPLSLGLHTFTLTLNSQNTINVSGSSITTYSRTINVAANTTVSVPALSGAVGDTVTLYSSLSRNDTSAAVSGEPLDFYVDGSYIGTAYTDSSGYAYLNYTIPEIGAGSYTLAVYFNGDSSYNPNSSNNTLSVSVGSSSVYTYNVAGTIGTSTNLDAYLYRTSDNANIVGRTLYFTVDGTAVGSAVTDSSGTAALPYSLPASLSRGTHTIGSTFAGDSDYNTCSSLGTLYAYADTTLKGSNAAGGIGQKHNLVATLTVTAGGAKVAGETVTFLVDGTSVGTAVTNAAGVATLAYIIPKGTVIGSHSLTFSFHGSLTNYYNGSSSTGTLTVSKSATTLAVANVTGAPGQTVNLKAVLKQTTNGALLSGETVTFKVGTTTVGTATTDGTGTAAKAYLIPASAVVGTQTITASYAGDANTNASTGTGTLTIAKSATAITVAAVSGNPGQSVTLSATLKAGAALLSGKTLTFKVDSTVVGTAVTSASGVATKTFVIPAAAAIGIHIITVTFAGDAGDAASTGTGKLTVTKAVTTLTVLSVSGAQGQTVTLTGTLKAGSALLSGKTLTFKVDSTVVGTAVTSASGVATKTFVISNAYAIGIHIITVTFAGDTGDAASTGTGKLTIGKGNTAMVVPAVTGTHGTSVTLTAKLSRTTDNTALAGKSISFKVGSATAGTGVTSAAGVASVSYLIPAVTAPGTLVITAVYAGDAGYNSHTGTGTLTVK